MEEVPIGYITNGIHTGTWLARRMGILFSRYMGTDWMDHIDEPDMWRQVENIPDDELWRVRRHLKRKLVVYMVGRARQQWKSTHVHPVQTVASGVLLDPYMSDHRFCPPFCDLQTSQPDFQGL